MNDRAARTLSTGANPRGVAIRQPKPKGRTVHDAIREVFQHQDPKGQAAVIKGVLKGRADPGTAKAIRDAWHGLGVDQQIALTRYLPHPQGVDVGHLLDNVVHSLGRGFTSGTGIGGQASSSIRGSVAGGVPGTGTLTPMFGGIKGGETILANTGKDVVDLPGETISSLGMIGGDVLHGRLGKAAGDVIDPYIQLAQNPAKAFYQHPLDTYLMAAAPVHGLSRLVAGGVRTVAPESAAGRALSTDRPGIQLRGNLTHERPRYSRYPLVKAGQVAVERARYKRNIAGQLVPRKPELQAKLTANETSRLVGLNERLRQANRDMAISRRVKAVTPGHTRLARLGRKASHAVKTATKYGPQEAATLPGAEVLARIADATIRRPDTFRADLLKHIGQVAANRVDLLDNPELLKEHDAYIRTLEKAAQRKLTPAQIREVFAAAEKYREDYKPVEAEAKAFGQFGGRSADQLRKRELMHYAVTHMDARFDPELGLVDRNGAPMSNSQIRAHLNGKNGTGGRLPAFTSDKPKGGSAFYLSSERRPLPEGARNTLFAYTHGLTDPSHQALLEQHVRMQGIVDAHRAQNRLVNSIAIMKPDGKPWPTYSAAKADAPRGYQPIALSQPFHPQESLDKALQGTNPNDLEQEAITHGLDLSARLHNQGQGRWALADSTALKRIEEHKAQIHSTPAMRAFKMTNNQFRQVALGTSPKHIPGVIQEQFIRAVASGDGFLSWVTGKRALNRAERIDAKAGEQARIQLTGGTVAGSAKTMMTRQTSEHFAGTNLYPVLKGFEKLIQTPGPRQLRTVWKAWLRLAINGTKRFVEEQSQTAGVGKAVLQEFASEHGPFFKSLRLQGAMLDDAARGLFDPKKLRQFRAEVEHIYGRWTDLPPSSQTLLMMSPFGLWWVNSVKWLARSPIDRPLLSGAAAAANVGTMKQREAVGLDLFAPNALPKYMQGSIALGGNKFLAQNYYSPFGVANDPTATGASLIEPWLAPILQGFSATGNDWLGKPLTSPGNPGGYKSVSDIQKVRYVVNSVLGSLIPLYTKAETVAEGGSSAYDSSSLLFGIQTKTPGKGFLPGLEKSMRPFRLYTNEKGGSSSSSGWGGSSSSGSGGWGSSSSSSSNGWG